MSYKRRIKALECLKKQRSPASLEAARRFFDHLHQAYGPPNTPAPLLADEELKNLPALMDAAIDKIYGGDYEPQL